MLAELATVVIQFGEAKNIFSDYFKISLAMLDVDTERLGNFRSIVGAQPWLEAGCPKKTAPLSYRPKCATQYRPRPVAIEPQTQPFRGNPNANEFHVLRTRLLVAGKFFVTD